MSGLDVLHKLRSENPGLPVLLTAKDAVEDRIATGVDRGGRRLRRKLKTSRRVVLRLRALLRRTGGDDSQTAVPSPAVGTVLGEN